MQRYLGAASLCLDCLGCSEPPPANNPAQNAPAVGGAEEKPLGNVHRSANAALAPYCGKNPVFLVFADTRDAFMQKRSAAEADLQAKNVVVIEVLDLFSAASKAQV
jgi:hypothetical protein